MRRAARLDLEQLQPYLLECGVGRGARREAREARSENDNAASLLAAHSSPLHWSAIFGNNHPVELEIGFGKGLFLVTAAQQRPDANFVGIEIERKYVLFTANRLAKRGLGNVRLICGDARIVLSNFVPAASLQAIHVYFPDPWWKTRHRKRRVFTGEFARQCVRALRAGGCLFLATDVEDYFTVISDLVAQETGLAPLSPPQVKEPEHDLDYLTNFERKYRRAGKPIYRASYWKLST